MNFTVFSKSTGELIRTGNCPDFAVNNQYGSEEVLITNFIGTDNNYLVNGVVHTKPTKPNESATWNVVTKSWEVDLEERKTFLWEMVKKERAKAFAKEVLSSSGIPFSISRDKANLSDRISSLDSAIKLNLATETTEILWSNAYSLNLAGYQLLAAEMGSRGQLIYEKSWELDDLIQACTTQQELELVEPTLKEGWP